MAQPNTENLDAKRAAVEAKLAALRVAPEAGSLIRDAASAVSVFKAEVAGYERQLDEIDAEIGARARGQREEAHRAREAERAAARQRLAEAAETELVLVERFQHQLQAAVTTLDAWFQAHAETREAAIEISGGARLPSGFGTPELVRRAGAGIAGVLATARVPGALPGSVNRIGALDLPNSSLTPASRDWREREERILMPALQSLLEEKR